MKNIAVIAGGFTGEFEVSIKSAQNIAGSLSPALYTTYTIIIKRDTWYYTADNGRHVEVDKNDFSINLSDKKVLFDAALITIHGTPGEDGRLQGYFDMIGMPYTTCDTTTAALTMNKGYTKQLVNNIKGLHTAKSVSLFREKQEGATHLISSLTLPLFVKPNNGGSSVGMSKVNVSDGIAKALETAFHEDEQVLVEEFISGREFSIGVYSFKGEISVLPPTEIISGKEFFDYEAKYTPGMSSEITPANLPVDFLARISSIVTEVYRVLNCRGMARIDFILQEGSNDFYFIEVNTTPGQSAASIYPQQLRAAGYNVGQFYGDLVEEAIRVSKL